METVQVSSSQENLATSTNAGGVGRVIANRIFVGNLPSNLVERDMMTLFNRFGKIRDVKIIPENSRNKSYGFVTFFSEMDARRAIQSCLQHDCVMWGDRRLNVAPAIKRSTSTTNLAAPPQAAYYGVPRIPLNQYYPTSAVPMPVYSSGDVTQPAPPTDQQPVSAVDSNGLVQTFICRIPHHQYSMAQCQYSSGSPGHYFVAPSYQPYVQAPTVPVNQGSQYGATAAHSAGYGTAESAYRPTATGATSANHLNNGSTQPLTPNSSSDNADAQLEQVGESSQTGDKCSSGEGSTETSHEASTRHSGHMTSTQNVGTPTGAPAAAFPSFQTYLCCPHSCMMSPVSPAPPPSAVHHPHPPAPPPAAAPLSAAALSRSCQMLHAAAAAAANCYAPTSPLIYASSPVMYSSARRSTRLQRWNSLDANLSGQVWNSSETGWSRPSLDDSYASETGLGGFSRIDRPLRPAFSCQSHVGMFSPFCRSYEYNLWGLGSAQSVGTLADQSEAIASVGSPSSSSHSSLSLNINLNDNSVQTDQVQQTKK